MFDAGCGRQDENVDQGCDLYVNVSFVFEDGAQRK